MALFLKYTNIKLVSLNNKIYGFTEDLNAVRYNFT